MSIAIFKRAENSCYLVNKFSFLLMSFLMKEVFDYCYLNYYYNLIAHVTDDINFLNMLLNAAQIYVLN